MNHCGYSPDGLYIISVSEDKTLKVWSIETGQCVHTLTMEAIVFCYSITATEDKLVASVLKDQHSYLILFEVNFFNTQAKARFAAELQKVSHHL